MRTHGAFNVENFLNFFAGTMILVILILLLVVLAYLVFSIVGKWKLYKKCGKEGWEAIIPFYSDWVLVEISGLKWYWFLIFLAPTIASTFNLGDFISVLASIAAILANVCICYNLSKKFNKSDTWFILSIFFGGITIPLLGLSSSDKCDETVVVTPNGIFDNTKRNN
ncbi:MAG: DUF5684 domain-containing protein [Bacilli bacterium]